MLGVVVWGTFGCSVDGSTESAPALALAASARPQARWADSSAAVPTIGVWISEWRKARGASLVAEHIELFDSVSPFSFNVDKKGRIKRIHLGRERWSRLLRLAKQRGVALIPTIAWMKADAIHRMLVSPKRRRAHVRRLRELARKLRVDGLDIDYEGKRPRDRKLFSVFIRELSAALHEMGVELSCTVEARTVDKPKEGRKGVSAMAWANDFRVLDEACDEVRLMAYDQWFAQNGSRKWSGTTSEPYAPNADIAWVESVLKYTMRLIRPSKIVLGIPTYGWLFKLSGRPGAWSYKRFKSLTHERASKLIDRYSATTTRDDSGELRFAYARKDNKRIGYLSDAESMRGKLRLAKKLGLKGVVLFKIEGVEDPQLWRVLREEQARWRADTPSR